MTRFPSVRSVSIYFKGEHLNPQVLTDLFEIQPTRAHKKGHRWVTSSGREVSEKSGLWTFSIGGSEDVGRGLADLIARFATARVKDFSKIPGVDQSFVDVFVAVDADEDGGGIVEFELDSECLRALHSLGLPVQFSINVVRE